MIKEGLKNLLKMGGLQKKIKFLMDLQVDDWKKELILKQTKN